MRDIRRAGAAALDLAWLAAGRVDAYFERGLSHWDWAAGRLLVEEAGGSVTVARRTTGPAERRRSDDDLLAELRRARRALAVALLREQVLHERLDLLVGQLALEGRHHALPGSPRR